MGVFVSMIMLISLASAPFPFSDESDENPLPEENSKKLIIAHRGASAYEIENTLKSFQKAIELKADMIEFDIRKTKDNILIVFHDSEIKNKKIKNLTYNEVENLAPFHIPTLEETLKFTENKIKLNIELKETGYEQEIIDLVLKYFNEKDFIISSKHKSSLRTIKDFSNIKTGLILKKGKIENWKFFIPFNFFPLKEIQESKADFIIPDWRFANKGFLEKAEKNNILVLVWVVNDKDLFKELLENKKIHGIITDKPDLAPLP
jgi:glycerophosphoryl diester phosphodiesterase